MLGMLRPQQMQCMPWARPPFPAAPQATVPRQARSSFLFHFHLPMGTATSGAMATPSSGTEYPNACWGGKGHARQPSGVEKVLHANISPALPPGLLGPAAQPHQQLFTAR